MKRKKRTRIRFVPKRWPLAWEIYKFAKWIKKNEQVMCVVCGRREPL